LEGEKEKRGKGEKVSGRNGGKGKGRIGERGKGERETGQGESEEKMIRGSWRRGE
jgi:hypothetical protein